MKAKLSANLLPILDAAQTETYRQPKTFHASGLLDCQRKQILGLLGHVEKRVSKPEWRRAADVGNAIHDLITNICKAKGLLEAAEVVLEANEFNVGGRVDGIINRGGNRRVLEIKSMNSKGYANFHPGGGEKFEAAYAQCLWYQYALGLERGYIIGVNRDDLTWKEYQIDYDDQYVLSLQAKMKRLNEYLDNKTVPPPERGKCFLCGYRNTELCRGENEDDWLDEEEVL